MSNAQPQDLTYIKGGRGCSFTCWTVICNRKSKTLPSSYSQLRFYINHEKGDGKNTEKDPKEYSNNEKDETSH